MVGIKLAGTAVAIMLLSATSFAQDFTFVGNLQADGSDIDVGYYANPVFADINNDGNLNLYVTNNSGMINVFIKNGNTFTATDNLQADGVDINTSRVPAFADIDDDGDLDLYVGNQYGNISVFTNDEGVFTDAGNLQVDDTDIDVGYWASPVFADIDDDGDLDLFVNESYTQYSVKFYAAILPKEESLPILEICKQKEKILILIMQVQYLQILMEMETLIYM